ncbi:lytic transglycosylase domain-containing protein [Clostridium sp. BJN0001]|uniref:lytic transglycosylase domain-containing protein n=1 Tax=Clostridium sp. BJN0001 TaxID=2930219 RepID=UPI001FD1C46A|nr:lytic transglycosylase domain-containing protein [Clostridium sp. BJN0001]
MRFLKRILIFIICILLISIGSLYILKSAIFPYKYNEYVNKYSQEYKLSPFFVLAVMKSESNFDDDAHSHKDAVGLMQITTETGQWIAEKMELESFSKDNLYNEEYNIRMGCWYLRYLYDKFDGNIDLIVAAYNAGPSNVDKWLQNSECSKDGENLSYIPFAETKKYVDKVNTYYKVYRILYDKG